MKIFVNARFLTQPLSGVQRYGIECSLQIKKIKPDITFLAPKNVMHKEIAAKLDAKPVGINKGHLWEQIDLPFFLAKQGGAVLLNLANTAPVFFSKNYVTIHDLAFYHHPEWNSKMFSAWYNRMVPHIVHKSRHIFTVSETIGKEISEAYNVPSSKISVTYNGISQSMLSAPKPVLSKKEKIILSVGTFNIRKNHHNLVKAFLASDIKNEYQLVLAGDKNKVFAESDLDEQLISSNNIRIYQNFSEEELIGMYRNAEVVVSLSLYEGFGIPILEGLYNGCKIVCSDIPVYRELYNGYATFCDPLDTGKIMEALNRAINAAPVPMEKTGAILEKYNYKRSAEIIIRELEKA
jgi:glycosyltransferase involved in cell wall biosynthesis